MRSWFFSCVFFTTQLAANLTVVSYAPIVEKVAPAVVNIYTTRVVEKTTGLFSGFFGEVFGPQQRVRGIQRSLGSGVIVRSNGTIITNAHVVKNAGSIMVVFEDGTEQEADLVVSDERFDLAALKLKLSTKKLYPYLEIAPVDTLRVGDGVLAVGNPRGLNHTVTAGIVSALGRTEVRPNDFRNLIQADLSLAQGSSGGALITLEGKLAGINTAILADGIAAPAGFAIPAELIVHILRAVDHDGKITYPFDGISGQPVTTEMQKAMGLPTRMGALVKAVYKGSPAEKAGIRRGDILMHIDGHALKTPASHQFCLFRNHARATLAYGYIRDNKTYTTKVTLTSAPESSQKPYTITDDPLLEGATVEELSPALNFSQDRDIMVQGVAIIAIAPHSHAHRVGFRVHDVLLTINGKSVTGISQLKKSLAQKVTDLRIQRGENMIRLAAGGE
ncbi:MAG: trypsin-like peptidase domain-containing protein [Alphaproteobacteria bacterium]|nr:MAG: trypsin-like peptidase domain-containing protein [Alphaproteobacteria bacterium]